MGDAKWGKGNGKQGNAEKELTAEAH